MNGGPGAAWQHADLVTDYIEERRPHIPFVDAQEEIARRLLTRGGRRIERFCDLGAGDGDLAEIVMDVHPASTCVLVDFSEPMLAAAAKRFAARPGRWEIVSGDLAGPSWRQGLGEGARFDAIVSRFAIHHLPHERKRALYREVFDLLSPGGLFLNWEHVSAGGLADGLFEEIFIDRLLSAESTREHPRPREEVVCSYEEAHEQDILASAEEQCDWLREIGFEQVDTYFKVPELSIFGGVAR